MDTSRLKLKNDFLTFLDLSYKKSNLGLTIKLERKLLTTAIFFSERVIFNRTFILGKPLCKSALIEDCHKAF